MWHAALPSSEGRSLRTLPFRERQPSNLDTDSELDPPPCSPSHRTVFLLQERLPDRACLSNLQLDSFPDEKEQRKAQRIFFLIFFFFLKKPGRDGNIVIQTCQDYLAVLSCTFHCTCWYWWWVRIRTLGGTVKENYERPEDINANKATVTAKQRTQVQGTKAREGPWSS